VSSGCAPRAALAAVALALALPVQGALAQDVAVGRGAVVRGLDKVSGETQDIELFPAAPQTLWRLTLTLGQCRYPADDPASNAFAFLTIQDRLMAEPVFAGWMVADSPALNAMDHARYDVWLIRCIID
jgi:hypothetical protein